MQGYGRATSAVEEKFSIDLMFNSLCLLLIDSDAIGIIKETIDAIALISPCSVTHDSNHEYKQGHEGLVSPGSCAPYEADRQSYRRETESQLADQAYDASVQPELGREEPRELIDDMLKYMSEGVNKKSQHERAKVFAWLSGDWRSMDQFYPDHEFMPEVSDLTLNHWVEVYADDNYPRAEMRESEFPDLSIEQTVILHWRRINKHWQDFSERHGGVDEVLIEHATHLEENADLGEVLQNSKARGSRRHIAFLAEQNAQFEIQIKLWRRALIESQHGSQQRERMFKKKLRAFSLLMNWVEKCVKGVVGTYGEALEWCRGFLNKHDNLDKNGSVIVADYPQTLIDISSVEAVRVPSECSGPDDTPSCHHSGLKVKKVVDIARLMRYRMSFMSMVVKNVSPEIDIIQIAELAEKSMNRVFGEWILKCKFDGDNGDCVLSANSNVPVQIQHDENEGKSESEFDRSKREFFKSIRSEINGRRIVGFSLSARNSNGRDEVEISRIGVEVSHSNILRIDLMDMEAFSAAAYSNSNDGFGLKPYLKRALELLNWKFSGDISLVLREAKLFTGVVGICHHASYFKEEKDPSLSERELVDSNAHVETNASDDDNEVGQFEAPNVDSVGRDVASDYQQICQTQIRLLTELNSFQCRWLHNKLERYFYRYSSQLLDKKVDAMVDWINTDFANIVADFIDVEIAAIDALEKTKPEIDKWNELTAVNAGANESAQAEAGAAMGVK